MKIYINALSARLGGGQTYLINLLQRLPVNSGLEIVVYAPANLELPENSSIKKVGLGVWGDNPVLRSFWELFVFPYLLKNGAADILFCPGGVLNTRAPAGCKTVTMFRNMIPFDMKVRRSVSSTLQKTRNWLLYRTMLKSMKCADLTIFISEYARSVIEKLTDVNRAVTIPHGINQLFKTPALLRPDMAPDGEYLLYVSRFDVYKHHMELIKGYSLLPEEIRKKYKLVIVGEKNSETFDNCYDFIVENQLTEFVLILGAVDYAKLPALYQSSYVNLFASSCENCPNIMLEALASGRPLLCSDVMPMPEFGRDNVIYFSPYDPLSIKNSMEYVLTNDSLVDEYSKKSKEHSLNFDWDKTAHDTWNEIINLHN